MGSIRTANAWLYPQKAEIGFSTISLHQEKKIKDLSCRLWPCGQCHGFAQKKQKSRAWQYREIKEKIFLNLAIVLVALDSAGMTPVQVVATALILTLMKPLLLFHAMAGAIMFTSGIVVGSEGQTGKYR